MMMGTSIMMRWNMIEDEVKLKRLFSPLKINSMELKNRIVMPAMTTLLGNADGAVSGGFTDYYTARALGGAPPPHDMPTLSPKVGHLVGFA